MNSKTKKLIRLCTAAGYRRVAIGVCDNRNAHCRAWPFSFEGSIFCAPSSRRRNKWPPISMNTWPPIWNIVERCGFKLMTGNADQVQIGVAAMEQLTTGVYVIKKVKGK